MERFAFISRHQPTPGQAALAAESGIELDHVGDRDGFAVDPSEFSDYDGVIVVHAAAALRLAGHYTIGVFENACRPVEGGAPQFEARALHIYTLAGDLTGQIHLNDEEVRP